MTTRLPAGTALEGPAAQRARSSTLPNPDTSHLPRPDPEALASLRRVTAILLRDDDAAPLPPMALTHRDDEAVLLQVEEIHTTGIRTVLVPPTVRAVADTVTTMHVPGDHEHTL